MQPLLTAIGGHVRNRRPTQILLFFLRDGLAIFSAEYLWFLKGLKVQKKFNPKNYARTIRTLLVDMGTAMP